MMGDNKNNNDKKDLHEKNPEVENRVRLVIILVAFIIVALVVFAIVHEVYHPVDTPTSSVMTTEKVYTPTFQFFVSKNDAQYNEYMKNVDEIEKEYTGRVNFVVTDIDEHPEAKENFGDIIGMGMPALIMLDTKNNISGISVKCVEKSVMVETINKALGE